MEFKVTTATNRLRLPPPVDTEEKGMVAEATGPAAAGVVDDMVAVDMVEPVAVVGEVMGVIVVADGVEDTVAVEA